MRRTQVLIVGQGIAGTALGFALEQRGVDFLLVDPGHETAASSVAVGLISPVTGQRMVKSWGFDQFYPIAKRFYRALELTLGAPLLSTHRLLRVFKTSEESQHFDQRLGNLEYVSADNFFSPSISRESAGLTDPEKIADAFAGISAERVAKADGLRLPFGAAAFGPAMRVDLPYLIRAARARWLTSGKLIPVTLDVESLCMASRRVEWRDVVADKMVLCAGAGAIVARLASNRPFQLAKGEILTLTGPSIPPGFVPSRGHWAICDKDRKILFGATYVRDELDFEPTEGARKELQESAAKLFDGPFEVVAQQTGLRAFAADKLPVGGYIDDDRTMGILGGLGSKGALYAPWLAGEWAVSLAREFR